MSETPITLTIADESATRALAARLGEIARAGDVIALSGALGAGKSVFARGYLVGAGVDADEDMPSPTFSLVQPYDGADGPLYHFDLYRLEREDEALELGIDDAFYAGASVIEWPDRLGAYLPAARLDITIEPVGETGVRHITLTPQGPDWQHRLEALDLG